MAILQQRRDEKQELPIKVSIAQGLPKSDKLELVAQKSTELGVLSLIPVQMDRSVVKWDDKKATKKQYRLAKIMKEAAEQSHRKVLPTVKNLTDMDSLATDYSYNHVWVASEQLAHECNDTHSLGLIFNQVQVGESVLILIGPEGGFSDSELTFFNENDWQPIRLGPRILRTETASTYILSALSFYFEEMRC